MGVDEFSPTMNRLNGSLTNTGRTVNTQMGGMSRSTGLLSEQFKILRRTAEYAVAGFGLYKIYEAISAYKAFRTELGLLNANLMTTGANLEQIGNSALKVSTATATPLTDILQSYQNLAATFPGISNKTLPVFSAVEAKAAKVMQVDPQTIGATIGGLATSFYGRQALLNPKTGAKIINNVGNLLSTVLLRTPNTSGSDLTSYLPQLAGGAVTAGFTLPQMLALFTVSQRTLLRPAQTSQYLRQLFIRLKAPTKAEQPFFAQAGLGPGVLAKQTGMQSLMQLIDYGIDQGATIDGKSVNAAQAKASGYKGLKLGPNAAEFFRKAIGGRIQSLVSITSLVRNFGQIQIEQNKLVGQSVDELNKRYQKVLDQTRFTQAGIAFSNMTTSMINDLNPLIQRTSILATDVANITSGINTDAQKGAGILNKDIYGPVLGGTNAARYHLGGITEIAGTAALITGLVKMGAFGKIAGGLSHVPGLGKLFGGVAGGSGAGLVGDVVDKYKYPLDLQALSSAMTGTANGTPSAPFWVVIHPLSATTVPGMFNNKKNQSPTSTIDNWLKKAESVGKSGYTGVAAGATALASRTSLGARIAAKLGPKAARALGFMDILPEVGSKAIFGAGPLGVAAMVLTSDGTVASITPGSGVPISGGDFTRRVPKGGLLDRIFNINRGIPKTAWTTRQEQRWLAGGISTSRFEQMLKTHDPYLTAQSRATTGVIGAADIEATFWLQPTEDLKNLLKPQKVRAHIPTKLFGGVGSPAPTTKSKPTARSGL